MAARASCSRSPRRAGVQVRHLRPSVPTLEDVFAQAVGRARRACRSTTRDIAATAGTRARAGRGMVGHRPKPASARCFARRAFIGLLLLSWVPFVVRAVQIYAATNLPQAQFLAPTREMFRQFLEPAGSISVLHHRLCRRRVSSRTTAAPTRCRSICRSRSPGSSTSSASSPSCSRSCCSSPGCRPCCWWSMQVHVRRQLHASPATICSCFRRSRFFRSSRWCPSALAMLALSSLSKSSRYVGVLYAGLIFFSQAIYGMRARHHPRLDAGLAVGRQPTCSRSATRCSGSNHDSTCRCWCAFLMIALLIGASIVVLERRVRGIEVVA